MSSGLLNHSTKRLTVAGSRENQKLRN